MFGFKIISELKYVSQLVHRYEEGYRQGISGIIDYTTPPTFGEPVIGDAADVKLLEELLTAHGLRLKVWAEGVELVRIEPEQASEQDYSDINAQLAKIRGL